MSCGIAAPMHMKRKFSTSFSTAGQDDNSPLQQKALKEEANKWHADRRRAFQHTLLEQTKGFIEHVKSRLSEDGLLQRDNICGLDREGKIWVGTIHKAKGRQFGAVIVPCAVDGVFGGSSRSSVAFEDDRRLLYVAASRAEKDLCFTYQGAYSAETQRKRMTLFLTSSAALPCVLQTQYPPQKVEPLTATKKSVYERSPTKLLPQHVVTNNYAGYNVYTRKL